MCKINGVLQLIQIDNEHLNIFFRSDNTPGPGVPSARLTMPTGCDFRTFALNGNSHVDRSVATDVVLLLFQIEKQTKIIIIQSLRMKQN